MFFSGGRPLVDWQYKHAESECDVYAGRKLGLRWAGSNGLVDPDIYWRPVGSTIHWRYFPPSVFFMFRLGAPLFDLIVYIGVAGCLHGAGVSGSAGRTSICSQRNHQFPPSECHNNRLVVACVSYKLKKRAPSYVRSEILPASSH